MVRNVKLCKALRNGWKRAVTVNEGPAHPKAKRKSSPTIKMSPEVRVTVVLFVGLGMNHYLQDTLPSLSGQTVINCDEWFHCFCG